jgi:alpha-L-fucosidase
MKPVHLLLITIIVISNFSCKEKPVKYEATWTSLEQVNPVPEWFKDAKFGIYFHWGVYSVPAFQNEWYPMNMYKPGHKANLHHIGKYGKPEEWPYHYFITGAKDKQGNFVQFAPKLKSEGGNFDPEEWADLLAKSGAKFAGPVAEHHDGFSMWNFLLITTTEQVNGARKW